MQNKNKPKLLDLNGLRQYGIPWGRIHLYRLVRDGKFPPPLKVGARNRWLESEVDQYVEELVRKQRGENAA
jgi:predicted DNA-binding transcriptional regulator AlpA